MQGMRPFLAYFQNVSIVICTPASVVIMVIHLNHAPARVTKYQKRMSDPLLDCIDIHIGTLELIMKS